ncbi:hypothetical protein ABF87_03390 [Nitrosomonas sp. JL21]|uniref:hypothetical protein n=1 Tax=Nitrosomonas sp. JL21 TaxID=153949 RepID=UPI001370BC1C|nr:hypothetical protein [Nitrosomonas sp. JL21]MBL8496216.1 hypothetical protein [Nitrosomonas sp.]MCC7091151.1 hypothetical protein [Nitrosomonas sp.]MXS77016.1 hypothetical protein [Nitrosomonas sp. JL21]
MISPTDAQAKNAPDLSESSTKRINIKMQPTEHTHQLMYSNLTHVQGEQGVVIIDFGFLDPQTINAVNQLARTGEKVPETINARMSCRMAISIEAATHLYQQLNQLMQKKG